MRMVPIVINIWISFAINEQNREIEGDVLFQGLKMYIPRIKISLYVKTVLNMMKRRNNTSHLFLISIIYNSYSYAWLFLV